MNFWVLLLFLFNILSVFSKQINVRKKNSNTIPTQAIPLYPSSNMNYYYTFLFLGNPLQKLMVAISILGSDSIFLCSTNNTENQNNHINDIYDPNGSTSVGVLSNFTIVSFNLFYQNFINLNSNVDSNSFQDSNINLGNTYNDFFSDDYEMAFQCLDHKIYNFFYSGKQFIAGVIDISTFLYQNNENDIEDQGYFIYALYLNEAKGLLKLLNKTFNYSKLDNGFSNILQVTLEKNETTLVYLLEFLNIVIDAQILSMENDSAWLLSFSTLTNFIQIPKNLYENFILSFRSFCQQNEKNCIGRQFPNSPLCFLNENNTYDEFFQSFPNISLKLNETFAFLISSEDYFFEITDGYFCLGIEPNEKLENLVIFGNYFLLNKLLFFDFQTSLFYLWKVKAPFDFVALFTDEIPTVPNKYFPPINALAIVLPIVFTTMLILFLGAYHIKRKQNATLNNLIKEKDGNLDQNNKNSFDVSYGNYERQKIKEKTTLITIELKESLTTLDVEISPMMSATKPLETIIVPVTAHPSSEPPIS